MFGKGKCFKKDCGCQKFWQKPDASDANMCGCDHHEAFHEQRPTGESSSFASASTVESNNDRNSLTSLRVPPETLFLATNRIPQEIDSIQSNNVRAFLRSEQLKGNLSVVATNMSNRLNFDLQKEHSKYKINSKRSYKKNKTKSISFDFTLIPKRNISTIPKRGNELWDQLNSQNLLLRKISFNQDDPYYINNQVTSVFPCLNQTGWVCYKAKTTSELPFEASAIKDLEYIRRASTSKSKVYIKPIIDNLCESSDSSTDNEEIESPDGSLQNLMKDFQRKLQDQYINSNTTIHITVNENYIVESLFQWVKDASDDDLLRRPSIVLVLEDVTDTGGVFRQIISTFWNKVLECDLYFTNGIIDNTTESHILGKMLFWTILHCGLWPQWLHKLHIQYFIDEKIDVVNVLKTTNHNVYRLYRQIKHNIDAKKSLNVYLSNREIDGEFSSLSKEEQAAFIAEYEIITIRKKALEELKLGFDRFNIINELKNNCNYHNLVRELYYKFTYEIIMNQFDCNHVELQALHKPEYLQLFNKFKEMLKSMSETELKIVMKFITGAEIIPAIPKIKISWINLKPEETSLWVNRLPRASTCGNMLTLCENYEMSNEGFNFFKNDLYVGFMNYEAFSESVYSRTYNINYSLQDEIRNAMEISPSSPSSSTVVTPIRLSTAQFNSTSTVRSSGNSLDNAIFIDDANNNSLELNADSHQTASLNTESQREYRWVNVNPLERRTRRRNNDSEVEGKTTNN
ncbi:hypothetical protein GLOIN_2v1885837 [Rhizophagus irregularis DAOM 181602=DAOM 197198]|uniref:HECT domain-containing protein n=1 Tax=Rhizophagus irregularis (strain DAOM 181602 / DAOM 197198 / MUCL 43194) TaxID=747089 RepID=A0A2P4NZ95_RHIID|nr:hypothetical protein GLOIN_2v1885837 [Rhizophagus irregularis DAOM 181602=DAOM 197198]POG58428.1 hypothetical protein GLOIN_2v1885837 [Rhizophagus irregularis DAOM 181602=DAOM 197198]|eukprot:XP_025165294.1 hypothetical protein GLOIN_2v1885837 [Rhizophagus irregularis DAOM 181602=DAOM 197198]